MQAHVILTAMITIPCACGKFKLRVYPRKSYSLEACHRNAQTVARLLLMAQGSGGVRVHRAGWLPQAFKQAVLVCGP